MKRRNATVSKIDILFNCCIFRNPAKPDEFKIKSLYNNDLILNIAVKSKETVKKLLRNSRERNLRVLLTVKL